MANPPKFFSIDLRTQEDLVASDLEKFQIAIKSMGVPMADAARAFAQMNEMIDQEMSKTMLGTTMAEAGRANLIKYALEDDEALRKRVMDRMAAEQVIKGLAADFVVVDESHDFAATDARVEAHLAATKKARW